MINKRYKKFKIVFIFTLHIFNGTCIKLVTLPQIKAASRK